MRKKNNLIIVDSLTNLLISTQIRRMYPDERFDIIIPVDKDSFKEIYESGRLKKVFNKVYCANYEAINNYKKKIIVICNIKRGIELVVGDSLNEDYTDLFFWSPSEFFYMLSAFLQIDHSINFHVYCDAFGGYMVDSPDTPINEYETQWMGNYPVFKKGLWNLLFKKRYKTTYVRDLPFDFYMFKSELSLIRRSHPVVEVPCTGFFCDRKVFNSIFDYDQDFSIDHKWVLLTNVFDERRDQDEDKHILRLMINMLDSDEAIIKPHPRCGAEFFSDYNVDIICKSFPLELFFLNNDVEDYIFVSDESSSLLFSTLVLEKRATVVWLRNMFEGYKVYNDELWNGYVSRMRKMGCTCFEPSSEKELKAIIDILKRREE